MKVCVKISPAIRAKKKNTTKLRDMHLKLNFYEAKYEEVKYLWILHLDVAPLRYLISVSKDMVKFLCNVLPFKIEIRIRSDT